MMKRLITGLTAAATLAALAGCTESTWHGVDSTGGTGGGSRMYSATSDTYDAYYDENYGPFFDGYWNGDTFYYRDTQDHPYKADDGHHFRKDQAPGYKHVHGQVQKGPEHPPQ